MGCMRGLGSLTASCRVGLEPLDAFLTFLMGFKNNIMKRVKHHENAL
jgi:hypothetical protein